MRAASALSNSRGAGRHRGGGTRRDALTSRGSSPLEGPRSPVKVSRKPSHRQLRNEALSDAYRYTSGSWWRTCWRADGLGRHRRLHRKRNAYWEDRYGSDSRYVKPGPSSREYFQVMPASAKTDDVRYLRCALSWSTSATLPAVLRQYVGLLCPGSVEIAEAR